LEKALTFGDYVIVGVYSDVLAGALYERGRNKENDGDGGNNVCVYVLNICMNVCM
jgi:hypothetical protein